MNATRCWRALACLAAICMSWTLPAVRADEPSRSVEQVPGRGFRSWVMTSDNRTLIVSPTDYPKLIYFDTVAGKKIGEIKIHEPNLTHGAHLALRGRQLLACGYREPWLGVLDLETGRQLKRIRVTGDKPHYIERFACHPTKGLVYVSDYNHQILAVNLESGAVHKTEGWGPLLLVDPKGKFLYAGTGHLSKEQAGAWKMDPAVKFDPKTARTTIVKYAIEGDDLKEIAVNRDVCNYSRNGYCMRLSADGKCIGMIGSGTRGEDLTLLSTRDLTTVTGRSKEKLTIPVDFALHPVLDLGVLQTYKRVGRRGETETSLLLFKPSTMEVVDTIVLKGGSVFPLLLTFGGRGTRLISTRYSSHESKAECVVEFIPLKLSEADRAALEKAYGKR